MIAKKIKILTGKKFSELYFSMSQEKLASRLGVSQPTIAYWGRKLGLVKTRAKRLNISK